MYSVTQRVNQTKQPRGGYINPKQFTVTHSEDNISLNETENISPALVGLCVDYLTRYIMGSPTEKAFEISMLGAFNVREVYHCQDLLEAVTGLDNDSIIAACQLCGYDVAYRVGKSAYRPVSEINPDNDTIENIRTMVTRSITFLKQYGPIVKDGFTFKGGYTKIISAGDGDFMTADTLWDFKVSKKAPTNKHTLQLLIYYLMGLHSVYPEFRSIKKLGIFNPRLNNIYLLDIDNIPSDITKAVAVDVIGYK